MSLEINIEKKLDGFTLRAAFTAGNTSTALLGASGCGKSMTLRCIAGIVKPDRGRIVLDGRVLFDSAQHIDLPPQQRGVGLLFQNYALFPNMTVEQNILCGLKTEKDPAARRVACAEMLRAMRLETLAKRYPAQLSGGQQQRAALARILVGKPHILMLDEPFSALDSYLREEVEGEVGSLLASFAGTALLVTHNRDEAYRLCKEMIRAADRLQEHSALHPAGQPHRPAGRLEHHPAAGTARPGGLHRCGHPCPRLYALRCGRAQRHLGKGRFHQREPL
uniref:sulfate/molybdate ABC transporter ATP-binding protein n=1 Tax=Faecalibacterium prausnitzii TaxID=853 RepID=UPI0040387047